jgi:hypothetical protein
MWVSNVRRHRKQNKKHLTELHISRLDEIGFIWDVSKAKWESAFKELMIYREKYGDCWVKHDYISSNGLNLLSWISKQRQLKQKLSDDQISRLDEIDFIWEPHNQKWERGFKHLLKYKSIEGDCLVPQDFITPTGFHLGHWVTAKRKSKDTLSSERIDDLNKIGFIWKPQPGR